MENSSLSKALQPTLRSIKPWYIICSAVCRKLGSDTVLLMVALYCGASRCIKSAEKWYLSEIIDNVSKSKSLKSENVLSVFY